MLPKRWWITPLIFFCVGLAAVITAWQISETAREILAQSIMNIAGALATPFILESSIAIGGIIAVITFNQWRLLRDGDEWVEMEITQPPAQERKEPQSSPALQG